MKFRTYSTLGLAALATLALAVAFDGVLLRRKFTAGTKDVYKITTATKTNADTPMGAQEMTIGTAQTLETTVDKLGDDGSATVTSILKTEKVDMDGPMAQMVPQQQTPPVKSTSIIDILGRTKETKTDGTVNPMAAMMTSGPSAMQLGVFFEFPEKALNPGDSWEVVVPKSPAIAKVDQKLTATFTGTRQVDGKSFYVVTVKGTLNVEPDLAEMMKNAPADQSGMMSQMGDVKVKGTLEIAGESLVDPATGNTVSSTTTLKGKSNVDVMNMTIGVSTDTKVTIKKSAS